MSEFDYKPASEYYDKWLKEGEDEEKKVGWQNTHSQELSFHELLSLSKNLDGSTLLDVGCGLGSFYKFLKDNSIKVDYTGFDINKKTIEEAKKLHPDARFYARDILDSNEKNKYDYVIVCGTLNYIIPDHKEWVERVLVKSFEHCKKACGFNMLSGYALGVSAQYQSDKLFHYASPEDIFTFCKGLAGKVCLNHDTQQTQFTVFMYKNYSRSIEYANEKEIKNEKDLEKVVNWYQRSGLNQKIIDILKDEKKITADTANTKGQALLAMNRISEARDAYKEAIVIDSKLMFGYINVAYTYMRESDFENADVWIKKAINVSKPTDDLFMSIANLYLISNKAEQAKNYIEKVEDVDLKAYLDANYLIHLKKYDESIKVCDGLVGRHPKYAYAYFLKGVAQARLGKWYEARKTYQEVLKILPSHIASKHGIVRSYIYTKDYKGALEELGSMAENDFSVKATGVCNFYLENYDDAKSSFKRAKKLNPNDAELDQYLKRIKKIVKEK